MDPYQEADKAYAEYLKADVAFKTANSYRADLEYTRYVLRLRWLKLQQDAAKEA